ncbi:hypothetical protein ACOZ32_05030 [Halobacterium sp. MBLA0001]|uniref:hypothetical protein n=1 Tax=Halobacterium sp. MBLA0001 TaxID=3413511 RepID=UPI003C7324C6
MSNEPEVDTNTGEPRRGVDPDLDPETVSIESLGIDGECRRITVEAMLNEKQVIDFDPTEQERSLLLGANEERSETGRTDSGNG